MKRRYKDVFDKKRRDLLKIITSAGISKGLLRASPLVMGTMYSRWADAQSGPNKSLVIYIPDGAIPEYWYPNSNLSSFPSMSQPYSSVASQCNFLRNMRHHSGGHGVSQTIINANDDGLRFRGYSFDINMGQILGANLPFKYVTLGVHSTGGQSLTRDNAALVPYEDNPFNAFNRLFGNLSTGGSTDPRLNVVDLHLDAINALKSKLGNYEQQRLDAHLTSIEETQQRLIDLGGGSISCNASEPSQFSLEYANFERQANLQADIIALAFSCNILASASLTLGTDGAEFTLPWLNFKDAYHSSIHGGKGGSTYIHYQEMRAALSKMSAYAISALNNRGVLNSTIVLEVSDMGHGDLHSNENIPLIMAGGGGAIQRGVSNAGNSSYTPVNMIHTGAVALNAHQSPLYEKYSSTVIPGVLA